MYMFLLFLFFFFQAEDGIRGGHVTGVQTCALPIFAAFLQGLQQWGWTVGGNVRMDIRFAADNATTRKQANDLASLAPDVILANSSVAVGSLLQATRTVPIVFAIVADPVGAGFVDSLARPGGNVTGFTPFEYGLSGKWLELLKQIAPGVTRVGVIR